MVKTVQKLFSLVTICQNCHQKQSALFFFWLTVYIFCFDLPGDSNEGSEMVQKWVDSIQPHDTRSVGHIL